MITAVTEIALANSWNRCWPKGYNHVKVAAYPQYDPIVGYEKAIRDEELAEIEKEAVKKFLADGGVITYGPLDVNDGFPINWNPGGCDPFVMLPQYDFMEETK